MSGDVTWSCLHSPATPPHMLVRCCGIIQSVRYCYRSQRHCFWSIRLFPSRYVKYYGLAHSAYCFVPKPTHRPLPYPTWTVGRPENKAILRGQCLWCVSTRDTYTLFSKLAICVINVGWSLVVVYQTIDSIAPGAILSMIKLSTKTVVRSKHTIYDSSWSLSSSSPLTKNSLLLLHVQACLNMFIAQHWRVCLLRHHYQGCFCSS